MTDPLPPTKPATAAADVLRSLAFYAAFYSGSVLFVLWAGLATLLRRDARLNATVRAWSRFHRACCRHVLGFQILIEGPRPAGPVLYAIRHESFFEAIDLPTLLDQPVIFAKAELMRIPLWGRAAGRYGLIAVERDAGAKALRAMLASARRLTADGRPLVIFPEGTRVPHGARRPLQSGFAGIYKLLGLPVVPVAVDSGPLYHRRWKRPGTVRYRFAEEIPAGLDRQDIEGRVYTALNALND